VQFNPRSQGDMKQVTNNRRSRSRSGGGKRQYGGGGRNSFESNGPDVKIRGTAQQIQEKYLTLAGDAGSSGDWISAEAYFQFAEHYHRIIISNASNDASKNQGQSQNQNKKQTDDRNGEEQALEKVAVQKSPSPRKDLKVDPAPSPEDELEGEAEVIDTSPAALAAAVAAHEKVEAEESPPPKIDK
jgi:hypothetical protein